jgi:beta-phosphoglucomutase
VSRAPWWPEAVFVDLDGTLADSLRVMRQVYDQFLGQYGLQGSDSEFAALNGPPLTAVVRQLAITHKLTGDHAALLNGYSSIIDEAYLRVTPAADAADFLIKARDLRCTVAIVTSNSSARTATWLAQVNLAQFVDFVVSGDDVVNGKPHPEPYLLASRRAGCSIAKIVAVEDSIQGARSAVAAGLRTYVLADSAADPTALAAARRVRSLTEAMRIICTEPPSALNP